MRVLYLAHTQDMSGASRSMMQMIKELRAYHAVEPFVVMPRIKMDSNVTLATECRSNGIPYIEHKMTRFKRHEGCSIIERVYFIVFHAITAIHIMWLLRKENFELVHSNSSVTDMGAYLSMQKKIPHVWHLREFGKEDFGLVCCLGERYEKWIYRKGTRFVAISNAIKKAFSHVIDSSIIEVVYNGILPPQENLKSQHDSPIINICMVGRVEPNKNQMEALRAICLLKEQGITNFYLHVIGRFSDEEYKKYLDSYIKEHDLGGFVRFLGARYDVPELLKTMDIGLMLSSSEAFGRVTVEYQMHNLAVVATDAGANAELIENGRTGLLYLLGHPEGLSECLRDLVVDHEFLCRIAHEGNLCAMKKYTSKKNSESVFALYQTIVAEQ